jgi:hypothetical protein
VLAACSDAKVDTLLYDDAPDRRHEWPIAFECPAATPGACIVHGAERKEHEDALDLAMRETLRHGGRLVPVLRENDLLQADGVGALLRFR